jgi:hypothetical protein
MLDYYAYDKEAADFKAKCSDVYSFEHISSDTSSSDKPQETIISITYDN